jgi:hypothetical protein
LISFWIGVVGYLSIGCAAGAYWVYGPPQQDLDHSPISLFAGVFWPIAIPAIISLSIGKRIGENHIKRIELRSAAKTEIRLTAKKRQKELDAAMKELDSYA